MWTLCRETSFMGASVAEALAAGTLLKSSRLGVLGSGQSTSCFITEGLIGSTIERNQAAREVLGPILQLISFLYGIEQMSLT